MSDPVILAIIGAFVSTVASAIAAIVSVMNSRKVDVVTAKVEEVQKATNGLTEKLEHAALKAGRVEGHAAGVQEEKSQTSMKDKARAEGVRDEKARKAETQGGGRRAIAAPDNPDPIPVKIVADEPVPVSVEKLPEKGA